MLKFEQVDLDIQVVIATKSYAPLTAQDHKSENEFSQLLLRDYCNF